MAHIYIIADDLGIDEVVSRAMFASLQAGLCDGVSIMPTGGWFLEACRELQQHSPRCRIGVHCVLTEGRPLTRRIAKEPRFCDREGKFRRRAGRMWRLTKSEASAVAEEIRMQIRCCREQGVVLTHVDSHHHIHEEWGVLGIVLGIAREEGGLQVRCARNCGASTGIIKDVYRSVINGRVRRAGLASSDLFGSWQDVVHWMQTRRSRHDVVIEAMVHPGYDEAGTLVDRMSGERMVHIGELLGRGAIKA